MNVPNALTLLRILLLPGFLIAVVYARLGIALVIFVGAGMTDLLDGFWARRYGQETLLGRYLDPVADKLLMTVSFVALAATGLLPAWLAILVVAKDLFVAIGVGILYFCGQPIEPSPSRWGKQATFVQVVTVAATLFGAIIGAGAAGLSLLYLVAGAATVFSGLHYILHGIASLPVDFER